jgi:hypothetical protein
MHTPPVPFAAIAQLFSIDKGTIRKHWQNFKTQENGFRMRGRLTVLKTQEINEIADVILNAQMVPGVSVSALDEAEGEEEDPNIGEFWARRGLSLPC